MVDLQSLGAIDTFDIVHKFGVAIIFIVAIFGLWSYFTFKKRPVKTNSKVNNSGIHPLHKRGLILLGIFVMVIATLFLNGILENIAGIMIIFLALWLSKLNSE